MEIKQACNRIIYVKKNDFCSLKSKQEQRYKILIRFFRIQVLISVTLTFFYFLLINKIKFLKKTCSQKLT